MFEHFTDHTRKVFVLAKQEAQRFNHEYIEAEHVFLGLIRIDSSTGATILKDRGVDIEALVREVEKVLKLKGGQNMVTKDKLPQAPAARKVLEYAIEEARLLDHNYIGTEHILLVLLREKEGIVAKVLTNFGLKLEDVRAIFSQGELVLTGVML